MTNPDLIEFWVNCKQVIIFIICAQSFGAMVTCISIFSLYDSPYDAYIYYMNVLADFETTIEEALQDIKPIKKAVRKKETTN